MSCGGRTACTQLERSGQLIEQIGYRLYVTEEEIAVVEGTAIHE
jgi:hypothetical protein